MQTVLNSLKGGVVPRIGLPYITVGRKSEIAALLHDVEIISEGGASFRFIVGRYGSGKSFLIQTIRNYVMDRGFLVADADLSPERRLQGTKGQGLATYRELISNLSSKTKPEGGALTLVLDRWISSVQTAAVQETGMEPGDPGLTKAVDRKIYEVTSAVSELVHGFEFARLLSLYYHAYVDGNDDMKMKIVRWFRGEYTLKREAKEDLGILMGATPQAIEDRRRGVYSYEALRSRLTEGKFSKPGARDLLAPVIRLEPLTAEEMLVLCEKLADMHAGLYGYERKIGAAELARFIRLEYGRIGADQNLTPREAIRDFIELLDLLYQNPALHMDELLQSDDFTYAHSEAVSDQTDKNYAEFTI